MVVVGVMVAVVAAGFYMSRRIPGSVASNSVAPASARSSAAGQVSDTIAHPIEEAGVAPASASSAPLRALDGSDDHVSAALDALTKDSGLSFLLMRPQIIQRIVATVDALPRREINRVMLPLHPPAGTFLTEDAPGGKVVSAQNDARFSPYMQVVAAADPDQLVGWYVRAYPLFQQAYRQLGYPNGYFNDRVITVIDNLLSTPDLEQRPLLVFSNGYYRYVDPSLESLSAGQRALLRAGPKNDAILKAKLRAIKRRLTGQRTQSNNVRSAKKTAEQGSPG